MENFSILNIQKRLASHKASSCARNVQTREAAVAIVLREKAKLIEILFIKRAQKFGDPWSGDMAFPGGHKENEDVSLADTAMRETLEETGLKLRQQDLIGSLSERQAIPRRHSTTLLIAPYIFHIKKDFIFEPNAEVDEIVWVPMQPMINGALHAKERRSAGTKDPSYNGYRASPEHFIWGLTYRTLQTLFGVIAPDYVSPGD